MTKSEVSSSSQNYKSSFFHQIESTCLSESKNSPKKCFDGFELASRGERVKLLKAGFTGKEIESEYLRHNHIVVIGVDWQDCGHE